MLFVSLYAKYQYIFKDVSSKEKKKEKISLSISNMQR